MRIRSFFTLPFLYITQVSAASDITKSDFSIFLKDIDPVNKNASIPTGQEALTVLLARVADLLLFLIPIIAGVSLIVAGYYYILSSGDSEKVSQAKTIIKWNAIAILVALFSYSLIKLIAAMLNGSLT